MGTERTPVEGRLIVDADGELRIEGESLRASLASGTGRYTLVHASPGLLILKPDAAEASRQQVWMAGELPSRTALIDIIGMIAQVDWQGTLHVWGKHFHRTLCFGHGALRAASSDNPAERLGSLLVTRGVLSQAQVDRALAQAGPERRLGQVLIERGLLDREQLFDQLRAQLEQIFYAALLEREGSYAFVVPGDEAPPAITVHLPVQGLLMEGVQRIDEMALFREEIPTGSWCPLRPTAAPHEPLDEQTLQIVDQVDGKRSIVDIAQSLGLDEFETTKAIYQLIRQGQLVLQTPVRVDAVAVQGMVERFNEALHLIFDRLKPADRANVLSATQAWMEGSGFSPLLGERFAAESALDPLQVLRTLQQAGLDRPLDGLRQSLHELVSFALFVTTPRLARDEERRLLREVEVCLQDVAARPAP